LKSKNISNEAVGGEVYAIIMAAKEERNKLKRKAKNGNLFTSRLQNGRLI
jgi:hypothetical protein